MKCRKVILTIITIFFLALIIVAVCYFWRRHELQEKQYLEQAYSWQNMAFPRNEGYTYECKYSGYETIDEEELYVCLKVYNDEVLARGKGEVVTLTDIKEYLESEYNSDGSLRIYSGYDHVTDYIVWYVWGGEKIIRKYWSELNKIVTQLHMEEKSTDIPYGSDMSIQQLQELIKKYEDPSYEIDIDILKGDN